MILSSNTFLKVAEAAVVVEDVGEDVAAVEAAEVT